VSRSGTGGRAKGLSLLQKRNTAEGETRRIFRRGPGSRRVIRECRLSAQAVVRQSRGTRPQWVIIPRSLSRTGRSADDGLISKKTPLLSPAPNGVFGNGRFSIKPKVSFFGKRRDRLRGKQSKTKRGEIREFVMYRTSSRISSIARRASLGLRRRPREIAFLSDGTCRTGRSPKDKRRAVEEIIRAVEESGMPNDAASASIATPD